ncbi:bifunctional diguanylate cyclase/phosphodiesterase [Saccharibacillus alkalitolerans]|uniref:EAL domain-containing protein n=1 Tax=Saccharibacillus alkalitolerans TaxID=2705290 RepID=A0ABX0F698_9BACL|nr:bifunctional diguanylate cyclase/phosphodiesterase [Saccharibacillus alkalitolerans]NGZ75074.1 EAL domain-containing protein [Saccharibacillus alkalitolerans]
MEIAQGTYNLGLVVVSCIISVLASYAALNLAGRIHLAHGKSRAFWLAGGAVSMGLGIWSMHFVGMLALELPMRMTYNIPLIILSMIMPIFVSFIALWTVSRQNLTWRSLLIGGLLLASGVVDMHYTGMASMAMKISYDPWLVALSVAVAVLASIAALALMRELRREGRRLPVKVASALVMGAAIAGMHYIGMAAASFHVHEGHIPEFGGSQVDTNSLALIIALSSLLLIGFTIYGAFINSRLNQKDKLIRRQEKWYRALYENNVDGIISIDTSGEIADINPAILDLTGLKREDFVGQPVEVLRRFFDPEAYRQVRVRHGEASLSSALAYETQISHPNGRTIQLGVVSVPVNLEGGITGTHIIVRDITRQKETQARVEHLAYHDELTNLPNRRQFDATVQERIERSLGTERLAVMVLDIDRFKMINDSLGHAYGDTFLQKVAQRIGEVIDPSKAALSRMGGDEFALLCHSFASDEEVAELAGRIVSILQVPYTLKDNDFYVSASIGIAMYPEHGETREELIKNADSAMYEVKRGGKNGYRLYSAELDDELLFKIEVEADLRKSIERGELEIHYQPQYRMPDRELIGMEALLRWRHPVRGMIPPGRFIPIAEETGLIIEIGSWVLREACLQAKAWHDEGRAKVPVSVNLSTQQFHQPDLEFEIERILAETGLDPQYLELEITESMMMDASASIDILNRLNGLGIRLSLDDFGTGYSSLSYLSVLPINRLKIDRSFVMRLEESGSEQAIVKTIIAMAYSLGMDVIAEGIETEGQLEILTGQRCLEFQGYYFSRPVPPHHLFDGETQRGA